MGKITKIQQHSNNEDKIIIFIDHHFCTSMRKRVAKALKLAVGQEWDCKELKEWEKFVWKKLYTWDREKERINTVKRLIESWKFPIKIEVIGFGANSEKMVAEHPQEKGSPDLVIKCIANNADVIYLEVTGTDYPRGETLWLRPDKIEYARNHPETDYFAAVVIGSEIFFIKPDVSKNYSYETKKIEKETLINQKVRRIMIEEHYVTFRRNDPEVKNVDFFKEYLKDKVKKYCM